jgi:DNA-binding CsgD family transcriptional regulator
MAKLLERSDELATFDAALAGSLRGTGTCVVVDGVAGIGKTALLAEAARRGRALGLRVWQAAGSELERDFPFGVARALLAPIIDGAAPVALRDDSGPPVPEGDPAGAVAEVRRFVVAAAGEGPLLLVVDDVHWADAASTRCLAAIARTIAEQPLVLVVAGRESDPLRALRRGDGAVALDPRPLSEDGTARLVRAAAPAAGEEVCRACHVATGGTPLYVREVARGLEAHGLDVGADAARRVLSWSPEQLTRAVGDRLAALAPEARALAQALAILDAGASGHEVGLLAEVDADARARAGDALRGIGILTGDRGLAFAHPVLRAATAATLLPGAADRQHRRAAALLAEHGADAQRVAAQVMACEPAGDARACGWLLEAAGEALTRRAPEVAVRQLRRALAEPPPEVGLRVRVLVALGTAEAQSLEQDAGVAHLEQAVALAQDPLERLDAALSLAVAVSHRSGDTAPLIAELLARLGELDDPRLVAQVEAQLVLQGLFGTDSRRATAALGARVLERVTAGGDTTGSPAEQSVAAIELAIAARDAGRVVALVRSATAAGEPHPALRGTTTVTAVRCLAAADALDAAEALLATEPVPVTASYEDHYLAWFRADVSLRRGALAQAQALADAAWTAACEHDWPMMRRAASGLLAELCAETGDHERGAWLLAEARCDEPARELPDQYTSIMLLAGRGRFRLAAGQAQAGLDDLLDCGRRMAAFGERNPALIGWWAPAALALGGAPGRALAAEGLALARGFGAARALGVAQRASALLDEDLEARGRGLRAARATLASSPARLEHARVTADLGRHEHAAGRLDGARALLLEAYEQAHRCGATALERETTDALRALGARPRSPFTSGPESLTDRERSVSDLAAAGATNREIAETLVVTVRTVEFHLSRAFQKLGIGSRTELAGALGGDEAGHRSAAR